MLGVVAAHFLQGSLNRQRDALGLTREQYSVTFQSRFGRAKWLEPYTEPTVVALAKKGVKSVQVFCPGFVADCLETLEEIEDQQEEEDEEKKE